MNTTDKMIMADGAMVPNPDYIEIDYKKKFSESTTENQRILAELEAKKAEIDRLSKLAIANQEKEKENGGAAIDSLYPGFEHLDDDAKENVRNFANGIEQKVKGELGKDPAIVFARRQFNNKKWEDAFAEVVKEIPELSSHKDEFKAKYFNADNVPDNMVAILNDLGGSFAFKKIKEKQAEDAGKEDRLETNRGKGGPGSTKPGQHHTLAEYGKMNPTLFASKAKMYAEDLANGYLNE